MYNETDNILNSNNEYGTKSGTYIKVLLYSLLLSVALSYAHVRSNRLMIWIIISLFLITPIIVKRELFLPFVLFFLPWSPVMKATPSDFSGFTYIIPVMLLLFIIPDRNVKKIIVSLKLILIVLLITMLTLFSKLLFGHSIAMNYIAFMAMLILLPLFLASYKDFISFEWCTYFLFFGIVSSCIAASVLLQYPHMNEFISIFENVLTEITRKRGFYPDSNFYSAQIALAIGCLLTILSKKSGKQIIVILGMLIILVYYGFLSVSKSFLITLICMLVVWAILIIGSSRMQQKLVILLCVGVCAVFVITSNIFSDYINMYLTRFTEIDSSGSITTGRVKLWYAYIDYLSNDYFSLLFGQGYTSSASILVNGVPRASHNIFIQAIYQLGLFGTVLLIAWINQFRRLVFSTNKTDMTNDNNDMKTKISRKPFIIILFISMLQWLSLDMLFVDSFFYTISLVIMGITYLSRQDV
ncbi:MAG: O-antigen ligase family protein [Oscillospiraceae bacterium]|nr:O-antigen ligase family protein [Oscillospiraceae bacterium]